jgi:surface antigen
MNPYPSGQCTWGAAELCSCLQNTSQYGNFGNGGDWFDHAKSIGLEVSAVAQAGWLASFRVMGWPDGPGDVGLILSVNPDNTVTRYGTNWHQDGQWSTDKVKSDLVIGSFKPPCSCIVHGTPLSASSSDSGVCHTFKWKLGSIAGANIGEICFDGLVGLVTIAGGLILMASGIALLIIAASNTSQRRQMTDSISSDTSNEQTEPEQQQPVMTPQRRDEIIIRARQRASARQLAYRKPDYARRATQSQAQRERQMDADLEQRIKSRRRK